MKPLQGKVALVTGGSSGIGQAIAIRLGADGASVAINYVGRPEGAISTKEAIEHGVEMCMKQVAEAGGRPILVGADVSDEHAVEQMFDQVMNEYGRLDILVNNAGISPGRWRWSTPPAASGSTASGRARPSRRSTGPGSTTRSSGAWWKSTSRCGGRAAPRRWPRRWRSCAPTRPPTSPARRCSSTAASPCIPPSRPPGPPSYLA